MGRKPANERATSKVKTRPYPTFEADRKSNVVHDNPRVQKQLNIAAEKMGKLKHLNGGRNEAENKKKKQKENHQKKTKYGGNKSRNEERGKMSESTGSISDTTGSGFMSGDSVLSAGNRGNSINKAPSSLSSERPMTERSSSPMETDSDTSDGESRSRVGSIISVGKSSSMFEKVFFSLKHIYTS